LANITTGSIYIDMDAKRQEVEKLISDKRNIDKQIDKLQQDCKHEQQVIKQVADESSFTVRYVCESCSRVLGWPKPEEVKQFLS
tara:strand:- start:22 stop:273 length:252 start_codon:yes stop_codon:yes gene_type:complete